MTLNPAPPPPPEPAETSSQQPHWLSSHTQPLWLQEPPWQLSCAGETPCLFSVPVARLVKEGLKGQLSSCLKHFHRASVA